MNNQIVISRLVAWFVTIALLCGCSRDHIPSSNLGPEAPTDLVGGAYSSSVIILNWQDNSNSELGFDIYRAGASWVKVGNVATDITSWRDTELQDSTLYRYYIEAIGQTQNSEKSNVLSVYTHAIGSPPEMPYNQLPYNGIDTTVTQLQLSWECSDPDSDILTYDLYFGLQATPPLRASDLQQPTYLIASLQQDTLYHWQVVAKDGHRHEVAGPIWYFRNVTP